MRKNASLRLRLLLLALILFLPGALLSAEDGTLRFTWAFVTQAPNGALRQVDLSRPVHASSGDLFKIYIEPADNAFVYLFLHDAEGNLQLLFPDSFKDFDKSDYRGNQFFIPAEQSWFTLDTSKGTERFYLIASTKRLSSLETLADDYQKAPKDRKSSQKQAILDEVSRLQKEHSKLRIAAEKPVPIAGGTRGAGQSVAKLATKVEASEFYFKTFRLEH
jgi:hypothetical protein